MALIPGVSMVPEPPQVTSVRRRLRVTRPPSCSTGVRPGATKRREHGSPISALLSATSYRNQDAAGLAFTAPRATSCWSADRSCRPQWGEHTSTAWVGK